MYKFGHKAETSRANTEFGGMLKTTQRTNPQRTANNTINTGHCNKQGKKASVTKLKPAKGKINGRRVTTLRDSGCTTICVNKSLVLPTQLTGKYRMCKMMDGTRKRFEMATVALDTPYIQQDKISVMCVEELDFGIVVGDIPGARCKCSPNPNWRLDVETE